MKVLLCDDDAGYRALARAVLEAAGVVVVGEAIDGECCMVKVEETHPEVILLDLNMPRVDGRQALARLRAERPETNVVMLSTAPAEENARDCMALGARAYIQKPRDVFTLPSLLDEALAA
jgi:DNA-binding NarL/FixJ family response regulator